MRRLKLLSSEASKKLSENLSKENLRRLIKHLPDYLQQAQSRYKPNHARLAVVVVVAYFLADTGAVWLGTLIPEPPAVPIPMPRVTRQLRNIGEYSAITNRNIFSSKGIIPEEELAFGSARKTSLPFRLVGTVVLDAKTAQSIATIHDTSTDKIHPVQVDDWIETKAQITRIEERRVFFVNNHNQQNEYVELPEKQQIELQSPQFSPSRLSGVAKGGGDVTRVDENTYEVKKSVIDRSMANMTGLLQEARAIPNFENGQPTGYKIVQIVPGSIFEKFGIRDGDVITAFNDSPVNDPAAAMRGLSELRNTDRAQITLKRNGKPMTFEYVLK